ncbi:AroA 5-enolpyruvylshikimate-3-phosphate synthase [Burkholderiaceae bacterium]|jgi:3-phosphoshikimate 1-carboxyvinyltransferase
MTELSQAAMIQLGPFTQASGVVQLPGSKSISNRALLLAALASGETLLQNLLDADDTQVMRQALRALGLQVTDHVFELACSVQGSSGHFPVKQADLMMGNAGTAIRPLTAALAVQGGSYRLSGVPRMHERPIRDLVDGLRQLGAKIMYLGTEGYPPIQINPTTISIPAVVQVRGDVSSQFLTALLMTLPLVAKQAIRLEVVGDLISRPYIEITLKMMALFGVLVQCPDDHTFVIPASTGTAYQSPGTVMVEGDASSASYFLAAGAIAKGPMRVLGVGRDSIQGDVAFVEALAQMGAIIRQGTDWLEVAGIQTASGRLQGITLDCTAIPDAAMTLAVVALFAEGETRLNNIASWRVKETDRIAAMAKELQKLGASVEEGQDYLCIRPPISLANWRTPAEGIDTYDDHRMAMCFSLASFGPKAIQINHPGCVAKTFPDYFAVFTKHLA